MNAHVTPPTISSRDFEMARRFLEALDPAATEFTFQWFADKGKGAAGHMTATLEEAWPKLVDLNNRGCGVFVTINETDLKGRKKENIVRARALFIDMDHIDDVAAAMDARGPTRRDKVTGIVGECTIKPSLIVKSSANGLHIYWLIDDLPLDEFTPLQKALAARFGSDPAVSNLDRVLRLPGLFHRKGKPQLVTLHTKGTPRYKLAEVVEAYELDVGASGAASRLGLGTWA